ncbi:MAG: Lipoprotein-releasing system permease protein [Verrucomicrobiaceae bacterium]|nr:Lipoprotein-releasing system permease protein [Verrucomicrobiaceae bacterium]
MLNNASLFLALRYLRPRRSFVSIITIISVLGIMLGVGVLIVVISVMKGFEVDFKKLLIGFEPHVVLVQDPVGDMPRAEGDPQPSKWQDVRDRVQKLPGVVSATPFVSGMVFLKAERSTLQPIEIYGMPEKNAEGLVEKLQKHLLDEGRGSPQGSLDMSGDNIVLGDEITERLGIRVGDKVSVYSSVSLQRMAEHELAKRKAEGEGKPAPKAPEGEEMVMEQVLTVVGRLNSEATWGRCYMPMTLAQELFELHGRVHGIALDIKDAYKAEEFKTMLQGLQQIPENEELKGSPATASLPFDWEFDTWMHKHHARLAAIADERVMMWFVMSFVILVAAFSVMNTTITVTVQKRREIGILTALGSRVGQIIGIFMSQALVVAVIGTILGYVGGMTVLWLRNDIRHFFSEYLGRKLFDPAVYGLSQLPAFTEPMDIVVICSVSILLCLAAAFVPAYFAARVDPAVALRD